MCHWTDNLNITKNSWLASSGCGGGGGESLKTSLIYERELKMVNVDNLIKKFTFDWTLLLLSSIRDVCNPHRKQWRRRKGFIVTSLHRSHHHHHHHHHLSLRSLVSSSSTKSLHRCNYVNKLTRKNYLLPLNDWQVNEWMNEWMKEWTSERMQYPDRQSCDVENPDALLPGLTPLDFEKWYLPRVHYQMTNV